MTAIDNPGSPTVDPAVVAADKPRKVRSERRVPRLLAMMAGPLVIVVASFLLVTLHVNAYTTIGPIDELQHIDYLYKSPGVLASGDRVGQDAMREEACRGIDAAFTPPACSDTVTYNPADFQEKGYNTAVSYAPIYYTLTRLVSNVVMGIFGFDSLVTAARLVGGLWLALGLLLTYAVGIRIGASKPTMTAICVVIACTPSILYPSATVTPDAMVFLMGALMVWTLLWWQRKPTSRWWLLALVSAFVVLEKMTNAVIVGTVGLYLLVMLVRALRGRDDDVLDGSKGSNPIRSRDYLVAASAIAVSVAVSNVGWLAFQASRSYIDPLDVPMNAQFHVMKFPVRGFLDALSSLINPLDGGFVVVGSTVLSWTAQRATTLLLVSALVAAALFLDRHSWRVTLARTAITVSALAGGLLVAFGYLTNGSYFPIPDRYATTELPLMAMLMGGVVKERSSAIVLYAVSAGMLLISLARLIRLL